MKPEREPECTPPETFPAEIKNRPALDRIAYRIGAYADARRWLLRRLDEDAVFAGWTYRGADDPGIALYEGAALLVDLLTLYQDAYANEAYLRTATWRESVADLVRLLGYRLKPGIGGTGTFAFEVKGTSSVALPADSPLKVDLAEVPETANFQTRAAGSLLPWLSRLVLVRPQEAGVLEHGAKTVVVSNAAGQTFAKNDRLLVGVVSQGTGSEPLELAESETVLVDSVTTWHGRTVITLQSALSKIAAPRASLVAFKLGRSFQHFGHNAPALRVSVDGFGRSSGHRVEFLRHVEADTFNGGAGADGYPLLARNEMPLDPQVSDLALGTRLALTYRLRANDPNIDATPLRVVIRRVVATRPVTGSYGALVAPVTIATIDAPLPAPAGRRKQPIRDVPDRVVVMARPIHEGALGDNLGGGRSPDVSDGFDQDEYNAEQKRTNKIDIRELQLDTLGEPFTLGAPWHDRAVERGAKLAYWGDPAQARDLLDRPIAIVPKTGAAYTAVVVDVQPTNEPDLAIVTLDREVAYDSFGDGAGTIAFGNLVDATQGKGEPEQVLGNGDDRATFQTFEVPKAPLTYLNRPAQTPPAQPEIEIVVGNRKWKHVDSLYSHGPDDEVYVVRQDASGKSWVQFGDGKMGARLPSGSENVRIRWRTGAGAFGPAKPGSQVTTGKRIDAITSVALPGVIAGGSEPETADVARVAAPLRVQSLDRLVSLPDIEAETLAIGGVERASATWTIHDGLPSIAVIVLMHEERSAELDDVRRILATANRARGPNRFPMRVVAGSARYVYLDLTIGVDPALELDVARGDVNAAIRALFARRRFGQPEYATRIEGTAQNVRGVRWASLDALGSLGLADDPAALAYPALPVREDSVTCSPTEVLRVHTPAFVLRVVPGADT